MTIILGGRMAWFVAPTHPARKGGRLFWGSDPASLKLRRMNSKVVVSFCTSEEFQKDLWGVYSGPAGGWQKPIKPRNRFCSRK